MKVTRFGDARPYDAPNHHGVVSLRLQGFDPDGPKNQWMGLSHYLPGGGAGPDAGPVEKLFFVVAGTLHVIVDGEDFVLERFDSCAIAPHQMREVANRSNEVATLLVVIPYLPSQSV